MSYIIKAEKEEIFDIELSEDLLKANEALALRNKELLNSKGITSIDVMGSVGTGKTSLIERMIQKLKQNYKIAVIAGDLTTTIDADLIAKHGVGVIQINTGTECHLDANLIAKALKKIELNKLNLLFIENVGNLICPVEFPLGSDKRLLVISLTEGPYIVLKHPLSFMKADVVVINKMDLANVIDTDADKLAHDVHKVNPKAKIIKTSCKNGVGVPEVIEALNL